MADPPDLSPEQHQLLKANVQLIDRALDSLGARATKTIERKELYNIAFALLARATQTYDSSRASFAAYSLMRMRYGLRSAIQKERSIKRDMLHAACVAGDDYLSEVRHQPEVRPHEVSVARHQEIRDGVFTANLLGYAGAASRLAAASTEEAVAARQDAARAVELVRRGMRALDGPTRRVLELRHFEGLEWSAVAEQMNTSERNAQRMHKGGVERLAKWLRARGVTSAGGG
jgi:RNA polymerase sigma factor (sigma-70 family)